MTVFVVVDIGCIECSEGSAVLGVFTNREHAEAVRVAARDRYRSDEWMGEHHFICQEVETDAG